MHREHEDGKFRQANLQILQQLDAVRPFKREIDDREIRVQRFDGAQCFRRGFRLPADLHIGLRVEQVREAVANHRVIIHEQDVQARLLAAVAGLAGMKSTMLSGSAFRFDEGAIRTKQPNLSSEIA